jgi:hypothetical protein
MHVIMPPMPVLVVELIRAVNWMNGSGIVFNVNLIILTGTKVFMRVQGVEDVIADVQGISI